MSKNFIYLGLAILFAATLLFPDGDLPVQILYSVIPMVASVGVNYYFHRQNIKKIEDFTFMLQPILWIAASTVGAALLPLQNFYLRLFFIFITAVTLIRLELDIKPRITRVFLENIFFLSAIGIFLGIWASDSYYTPGWWEIMAITFAVCLILFWVAFHTTPVSTQEKILYTTLFSFLFTQISWALLFLPLHFLTTTAVISGFFYIFWILTRLHFLGTLNFNKVIFYVFLVTLMEVIVLSSAVWLPKT